MINIKFIEKIMPYKDKEYRKGKECLKILSTKIKIMDNISI